MFHIPDYVAGTNIGKYCQHNIGNMLRNVLILFHLNPNYPTEQDGDFEKGKSILLMGRP